MSRIARRSMLPASLVIMLSTVVALDGCALRSHRLGAQASGMSAAAGAPVTTPAAAASRATPQLVDANGAAIQTIPFHTGVSSATVEKLARQRACTGGQGASLVTEPGSVEVYRMQCENGKVFMARCEMRQCQPMAR